MTNDKVGSNIVINLFLRQMVWWPITSSRKIKLPNLHCYLFLLTWSLNSLVTALFLILPLFHLLSSFQLSFSPQLLSLFLFSLSLLYSTVSPSTHSDTHSPSPPPSQPPGDVCAVYQSCQVWSFRGQKTNLTFFLLVGLEIFFI